MLRRTFFSAITAPLVLLIPNKSKVDAASKMPAHQMIEEAGLAHIHWGRRIIDAEKRGRFSKQDFEDYKDGSKDPCGCMYPRKPFERNGNLMPTRGELVQPLFFKFMTGVEKHCFVTAAEGFIEIESFDSSREYIYPDLKYLGGDCEFDGLGQEGDCGHAIGLPGKSIPGQHDGHDDTVDVYGKPNGWCWQCWKSYQIQTLRKRNSRLNKKDLGKHDKIEKVILEHSGLNAKESRDLTWKISKEVDSFPLNIEGEYKC